MFKGSLDLRIPIIERVREIWYKVFFEPRVSFDVMVRRKKTFLDSSHRIETHPGVFEEVLEVHRSVYFDFCLDGDFIDFFEIISCLMVRMAPIFVEFPPSNCGAYLLASTTVVGYWAFGETIFSGE